MKEAVIAASALSLLYPASGIPGYSARGVPGRSRAGSPDRHPPVPRRRRDGADRLHRGTARRQARPVEEAPRRFRRPQQPRPRGLLGRGEEEDRRPHLPRRRSGLDPQRRRGLCGAPARALPHRRRQLLRPARERGGPSARPEDPGRAREGRPPRLRRRHRPDLAEGRNAGRGARPHPRGRALHRSGAISARPTTAASRRSATTSRPRATRPSPRSARGSRATPWRRRSSASSV